MLVDLSSTLLLSFCLLLLEAVASFQKSVRYHGACLRNNPRCDDLCAGPLHGRRLNTRPSKGESMVLASKSLHPTGYGYQVSSVWKHLRICARVLIQGLPLMLNAGSTESQHVSRQYHGLCWYLQDTLECQSSRREPDFR